MVTGICKYCNQEKELICSHIIPKCLFRLDQLGPLASINSKEYKIDRNPIHQNGMKEYLMCAECDNEIGKLDKYASKIFKQIIPNHKWEIINGIETCRLSSKEIDCWKFKKFFISVMWRLSVSAGEINLGPYEYIAYKMLKGELTDNADLFLPLIYCKKTGTNVDVSSGVFSNKTEGKRMFIIHFPYYEILLIPCTKYAERLQYMDYFKSFFTSEEVLVHKYLYPPYYYKQLADTVVKCQQRSKGK